MGGTKSGLGYIDSCTNALSRVELGPQVQWKVLFELAF